MESLFSSKFVLGFGLDQSMFKSLQYLTLNQSSETTSSSATTLLCIFKHNVSTSVLIFPPYFTNNANPVTSQSILEHKNM